MCALRHADGKLIMFLAIDRVSKFTYIEFHDSREDRGLRILKTVVEVFPYRIHIVLTDNSMASGLSRLGMKPGLKTRQSSRSIRTTSFQDYTAIRKNSALDPVVIKPLPSLALASPRHKPGKSSPLLIGQAIRINGDHQG
jgi:hypothetical protein